MTKWLIPICLLWTAVDAGPAYRWVDENGQVHYSDRPVPGAARIELTTARPSAPSADRASLPRPEAPERRELPPAAYAGFAVLQPARQETLWGTGGRVDVTLQIRPELQPGHHLGYYLDGEFTDTGSRGTRFQLQNVDRGAHSLQAVILDGRQEEVLRSSTVTFFVQQTSLYYPRNPYGIRPGG